MTRKVTTEKLGDILRYSRLDGIGKHWASEVTIDWGMGHKEKRVDYMLFEPEHAMTVAGIEHGIFTCFEVKSCKEDVYSGNGLNFIGDKNYLVTTMQCWKEIQYDLTQSDRLINHVKECNPESNTSFGVMVAIPKAGGYNAQEIAIREYENPTPIEAEGQWQFHVIRNSHKGYRKRSATEMLFFMLRSGQ